MAHSSPLFEVNNSDNEVEMTESSSTEGRKFCIKSTPECPWYRNRCFDTYWQHYVSATGWMMKHRQVQQEMQLQQHMAQYIYAGMMSSLYSTHCQAPGQSHTVTEPRVGHPSRNRERGKDGKRSRGKSAQRKRRQKGQRSTMKRRVSLISSSVCDSSIAAAENEVTDTVEGFELNISEDFMQFLEKSEKHRKERDAKKMENTAEGDTNSDYVEIEEVSWGKNKATTLPPSQRPGFRRTQEMKYLYGEAAPKIHGMETAMQLNYDRNLDIKQPKLWPNMPLRLKLT